MSKPFVFISGIDGTADLFRTYESRLHSLGYVVLFYEHAQHTRSSECAGMDVFVKEIASQMDIAGFDSAVICGESFGGPIAQLFARTFPERTRSLILLGTFAHLPFRRRAWLARTFGRQLASIARLLPHGLLRFSRRIYNPSVARTEPPALQAAVRKKRTPSLATYLFKACLALEFDSRSWLPQITAPTLIIAGKQDRLIPPACSREISTLLPNAKLVFIPNSGHLSHYAYPEKFWSAMESFL